MDNTPMPRTTAGSKLGFCFLKHLDATSGEFSAQIESVGTQANATMEANKRTNGVYLSDLTVPADALTEGRLNGEALTTPSLPSRTADVATFFWENCEGVMG